MKTLYQIFVLVIFLSSTIFGQISILIDPGHGGTDIGTPGSDGNGYPNEEDITLILGNSLRTYLVTNNITSTFNTYMTRISDVYVSPADRAKIAKGVIVDAYWLERPRNGDNTKYGVDFFFSIHCNSNGTTSKGTLALVWDAVNDQTPSDKTTNDYKFAKNVVKDYVEFTKSVFTGASIRTSQYSPDGVGGRNNLTILTNTNIYNKTSYGFPRFVTLLETEFASNPTIWAWLQNASYQNKAVAGMAEGIKKSKQIVVGIEDYIMGISKNSPKS
jgi:N-acetylmuramoyl-L-alanine amidase